jgi:hypothetical protein
MVLTKSRLTKSRAMMGGLGLGAIHPAVKGGYNAYAKNRLSRSKSTFSKYSKSRRYKRGKGIRKTRKHKSR